MDMLNPKKHLSFDSLLYGMSRTFDKIEDHRVPSVKYGLRDTLMSGFAMMFTQEPSLLQFQQTQKNVTEVCNLETVFGVKDIPKDSQMRDIIDNVDRENFRPIFSNYFERLRRGKHLENFELFPNQYYLAIDGSQYFGSEKVQCPGCLEKHHKNGSVSYAHHILQGAIMHPDQKVVIPFMPMEIRNEDGHQKQDCEMNAAKRFIDATHKDHPRLNIILGGDGLFSKQPVIEDARDKNMNFIFVAKPDDHKVLMEWVDIKRATGNMGTKTIIEGNTSHIYEWVNQIPLNGNKETVIINYFRYQKIINENGVERISYRNSWVTDFLIGEKNIETLVRGGKCRWKVENECFNTLKNQGYNIEHNYGHGEKNLSFNFLCLILLAFYFHQIFELTDGIFQDCRKKWGSKKNLWSKIRALLDFFIFDSWYHLLEFLLNPQKVRAYSKPP